MLFIKMMLHFFFYLKQGVKYLAIELWAERPRVALHSHLTGAHKEPPKWSDLHGALPSSLCKKIIIEKKLNIIVSMKKYTL